MTNQEQFLIWCEENHYEVEQVDDRSFRLTVVGLLVKGSYHPLQINPVQSSDALSVYFNEKGDWAGGSSIIWNTGLDWMK